MGGQPPTDSLHDGSADNACMPARHLVDKISQAEC
jgi:hypothetical protein